MVLTPAVVMLALAAFGLSFVALRDLAVLSGIEARLAWIWPVVVDGFICVATVAAVALRPRGWRIAWYPWMTLMAVALVSVAGNALHASSHADLSRVSLTVATLVSAVPPAALLCASHLLVVLLAPAPSGGSGVSESATERDESGLPVPGEGRADGAYKRPSRPNGRVIRGVSNRVPFAARPTSEALRSWIAEESRAGRSVTGARVAERYGVSPATGRRWLRNARDGGPDSSKAVASAVDREFLSDAADTVLSANGAGSTDAVGGSG